MIYKYNYNHSTNITSVSFPNKRGAMHNIKIAIQSKLRLSKGQCRQPKVSSEFKTIKQKNLLTIAIYTEFHTIKSFDRTLSFVVKILIFLTKRQFKPS